MLRMSRGFFGERAGEMSMKSLENLWKIDGTCPTFWRLMAGKCMENVGERYGIVHFFTEVPSGGLTWLIMDNQ